jgi:hypothetical protein
VRGRRPSLEGCTAPLRQHPGRRPSRLAIARQRRARTRLSLAPEGDDDRARASSFSRVIRPPSFVYFPSHMRGSGAPIGARVQRHPYAGQSRRPAGAKRCASHPMTRDARLSALHRGDCWLRARLDETVGRCTAAVPFNLASVHSHVPLVVAGGRVFPVASRVLLARQPAGRRSRSDSGSSPETPSVNGTRTRVRANERG